MTNTVFFFTRNDWTAISQEKKPTHEKDWCRHGIEIYSQSRHSDQMDEYLKKICYVIFFTIKNSYVYVTRCTSFIQMHLIDGIYYLLFVRQECDKNFLDINYLL